MIASGCNSEQAKNPAIAQTPNRNIWTARKVSRSEIAELESAFNRYLDCKGIGPDQIEEKRKGLTDEQILQIEEGICTRLPEDLKTFLGFYLTNGNFFGDLCFFERPGEFITRWKQKVELQYNNVPNFSRAFAPLEYDPSSFTDSNDFQGCFIPIGSVAHENYLFFDIRGGQIMLEIDLSLIPKADSLAELLDEITEKEIRRLGRKSEEENESNKEEKGDLNRE